MTNALDGPIYFGLCMILLTIAHRCPGKRSDGSDERIELGVIMIAALITGLPFLMHSNHL